MTIHDALKNLVLDHIAVAVDDLDKSVLFYQNLGLVFEDEREVVEEQKVITAFSPIDHNTHLELLTPYGIKKEDGAIFQYLQKKGPGIHHLCFTVLNLEQKCFELKALGVQFLYSQAKIGAKKRLVNFIHPKSAGGVLIELSQKIE